MLISTNSLVRVSALFALAASCARPASAADAPAIPRPEHPRPDAVRAEWLNLNGSWEFAEGNEPEDARRLSAEPYPDKINVPFCRESEASGLGRKGFVKNVWYRRSFTLPPEWKSPCKRLHIGACDWRTRVWVNGRPLGTHTGGNVAFWFDATDALRAGENTITIHAFDDTASGMQALGKQSNREKSYSIFYTRTTGIWQTVWLEGVGESFISEFRVEPDPANARVSVHVNVDGPSEELAVIAEVTTGGAPVAMAENPARWRDNTVVISVPSPRLWSPEEPFLYDLRLTLLRGGAPVDEVSSYFGFRDVKIQGAAILINGRAIFQRLVLDQGFYPQGVWTPPTDEALRGDIELSKAVGFNGARLHQKVFEPRFLYWADKLGYLVWGEFPSYGARYQDPAVNTPIIQEWGEIVARDRNHPSIIGWCPFNETPPVAGALQNAVVELTKRLDPSRPIIDASGWTHSHPAPEVSDAHDYNQRPETFREKWMNRFSAVRLPGRYGGAPSAIPFMVSEYGGIGWFERKEGETSWGYGNMPQTPEAWRERYKGLTDALLDNPNMFGFCYTQLTDIEQEKNGVYTYDRKPKFESEWLRGVNTREAMYEKNPPLRPAASVFDWSVAVGAAVDGPAAARWRYSAERPAEGWKEAPFDDSGWREGLGAFGAKEGAEPPIQTPWTTKEIWLRTSFEFDGAAFDAAQLVIHHDDEAEVYVNGQKLWSGDRWNDQYEGFDVTGAARELIKPGKNTLAVHVHQDKGGQFIDLALLLGKRK